MKHDTTVDEKTGAPACILGFFHYSDIVSVPYTLAPATMNLLLHPVRTIVLLASLSMLTACAAPRQPQATSDDENALTRFVQHSVDDHRRHYQSEVLLDLLPPLLLAGSLANTNADQWIRDTWQDDIRSNTSNDISRVFLRVGDAAQNKISLPIYSITMLAAGYDGDEQHDSAAATWAARSLRANILGGPQAFVLTYGLGSHRPQVGSSHWNPDNDNDGVSGHTFYGAVPFLTAARMVEQDHWRYTLYALSVMPGISRINDNQHYTSQVVMGWSLAWLATRTVANSGTNASDFSVTPLVLPDGAYVVFNWQL